jgi:imidazole glycerol phosphate synthase subunit HisF
VEVPSIRPAAWGNLQLIVDGFSIGGADAALRRPFSITANTVPQCKEFCREQGVAIRFERRKRANLNI